MPDTPEHVTPEQAREVIERMRAKLYDALELSTLVNPASGVPSYQQAQRLADNRERVQSDAATLRAFVEQAEAHAAKAIRFDLDVAGIASREAQSVELVELRAEVQRMRTALNNVIEHQGALNDQQGRPRSHSKTIALAQAGLDAARTPAGGTEQ